MLTRIARPTLVPTVSKARQAAHAEADVAGAGAPVVAARADRPRGRKMPNRMLQVASRHSLASSKTRQLRLRPLRPVTSLSKKPGNPGNVVPGAGVRKKIRQRLIRTHQAITQHPANL